MDTYLGLGITYEFGYIHRPMYQLPDRRVQQDEGCIGHAIVAGNGMDRHHEAGIVTLRQTAEMNSDKVISALKT